jgi:hypothetical protein
MRAIAEAVLWTAEIYLLVGAVLALGFAASGVGRVLPEAGHFTLGARLIVLPAAVLLWPVALYRWWGAAR